jgi:hypothetical protein
MKPPRHLSRRLTGLSLLLGPALIASANLVTFQINLGIQTQLGNFNPGNGDLVRIAGNFGTPDWNTTSTLTSSLADPNIYEGTFNNDIAAAGNVSYKFIIDPGGNSPAASLVWESIANRGFQATAGDQTLPVVYFNNISSINTLVTTQVTFQVNMGVQIALGNFVPDNGDVVYVAGDPLNNWVAGASVLAPSGGDTNIYVGTFPITNTVGSPVNYKFIMNTFVGGQQWEANGVGPNGAQNRQFTFTNVATTLPVVFFNNITNSSSLVATQLTFSVNLAERIARGAFDPNGGTVSVAGDAINNWNATLSYLTQSLTNPSVWTGTFTITNTVGSAVNFKYTLNGGGTWENNGVGPGGANDRQLIFANSAITLPDVFFNNVSNLGPLTNTPPSGGLVNVSWAPGPLIRLQTNSILTGVWVDVPGSLGLGAIDVDATASPLYFRLIGPW